MEHQARAALAVLDCQIQFLALLCFMQVAAAVADSMPQQALAATVAAEQVQVVQAMLMELLAQPTRAVAAVALLERLVETVVTVVQVL